MTLFYLKLLTNSETSYVKSAKLITCILKPTQHDKQQKLKHIKEDITYTDTPKYKYTSH